MRSAGCWSVFSLVLMHMTGASAFRISRGRSVDHQEITEAAILTATVRACRSLAEAEGRDFVFPTAPLTVTRVIGACDAAESTKSFHEAIREVETENKRVDVRNVFSAGHHFDDESFEAGQTLITDGLDSIKASNKLENFVAAREKLGEILHTLQDFYSHSNWVELGRDAPNVNLITPGARIGTIDLTRPTCQNCVGDDCTNNIREDIIRDQILTTGYFNVFSPSKPTGKCSHGGRFDRTSRQEPIGGINKDALTSDHGHLHNAAATLAIAATVQLLDDIRGAAGSRDFLRLMGISSGSNKALCFVVDTTGSMADDIDAVKAVTASLVNSKAGTRDEPSLYILVPFNDPDFGPLMRTTDANVFKTWLNNLMATGGGDFPEMALSGLQLALAGAPPGSEIFLFTDATAKDIHLIDTVVALIERTRTVVNFMLTGFAFSSPFRSTRDAGNQNTRMAIDESQLYTELAHASGGQAIHVTKDELPEATSIITDSSAASLVTLLQAVRNPGSDETFSFSVDESVRNLTIYITGAVLNLTLTSPSGVSQSIGSPNGSLAVEKVVGNLRTLQINAAVGIWKIMLVSTNPYTMRIIGQSGIDFLFDFVQFFQGVSEGFDVIENRPRAGDNFTLLVTLTGSDSAAVTNVMLVESSGSRQVNGAVETLGGGDFLARFNSTPTGDFVVLMRGRTAAGGTKASPAGFQRQSATRLRTSALGVTATPGSRVTRPGSNFSFPFTVTSNLTVGNIAIQVTNDLAFPATFPTRLEPDTGGSANGTVTLMVPSSTRSGTTLTVTIQAEVPGDTNFAILRISIVTMVTDRSRPVCQVINQTDACPSNCSRSDWEVTALLTDGANSTGNFRLTLDQGSGTLNTSQALGPQGGNATLVTYTASCCAPVFVLLVADAAGNVGTCSVTVRGPATTTEPPVTTAVTTPVTTAATTAAATAAATPAATTSAAAGPRTRGGYCFWPTAFAFAGAVALARL